METNKIKQPNIYVILVGGLGNQLFLYATGRAIEQQHAGRLVLDTSFFDSVRRARAKDGSQRAFGLDELSIRYAGPSRVERRVIALGRLFTHRPASTALWNHTVGRVAPRLVADTLDCVTLAGLPPSGDLILQGYFQSYHHFQHLRPVLLEELAPRDAAVRAAAQSYVDHVRAAGAAGEVISLHVRRGDYAMADVGLHMQPLADIERRIALFNPQTPVIVFSDDPAWCRTHFTAPRFHFRCGQSAVADLYAMSLCDHNIIANSSLSWWGAWLNRNPAKRVVVPSLWFTGNFPNWRQRLVLPGWEIV